MTKRKITYAVLALLTLGFTACSQEEEFAPQGGAGQEIRLATRATTYDGDLMMATVSTPQKCAVKWHFRPRKRQKRARMWHESAHFVHRFKN